MAIGVGIVGSFMSNILASLSGHEYQLLLTLDESPVNCAGSGLAWCEIPAVRTKMRDSVPWFYGSCVAMVIVSFFPAMPRAQANRLQFQLGPTGFPVRHGPKVPAHSLDHASWSAVRNDAEDPAGR
jgi:hypothetical protein